MPIFNIQATPPTAEAIGVARLKIRQRGACVLSTMLLLAAGFSAWLLSARPEAPLPFFVVLMILILMATAATIETVYRDLGELSERWCEDFHEQCKRTPEGLAYRAAVLEQARKFTNAEHTEMRSWADGRAHRDACNALYNIPA